MWDYLEPLAGLLGDNAAVVRYDQRGSGRSPSDGPYSVAQFVADLDDLRAHLGYDTWVVGGHSWGATLALHYAFAHPAHTSAIVYVSGVGIGRAWNRAYHQEADRRRSPAQQARLDELIVTSERTAAEEHEYRALSWFPDYPPGPDAVSKAAALAAAPYPINHDANRAISNEAKTWTEADLAARATALTMPVLIVHGELDPRPPWAVDSLAAALPRATVCKLPGLGHVPWVDDPDATAAPIRAFLASL